MQASENPEGSAVSIGFLEVHGARLSYAAEGQGPTVLFVHGALADFSMWDRHRAALAGPYRAVSFTQRYFGMEPWGSDWPPFGIETHSDDLLEVIRELGTGPVHLVAWSYAGHIALHAALRSPELFRSVFIYEPGVPTYVSDPADLAEFAADANAMFGPVFAAAQAGDNAEAVRRLIDGSGQRSGYFDAQPKERRDPQMERARTMPLQLAQSAPPVITCGQLSALTMPVCIARGEVTRLLFRIVSDAAARCIPNARHIVVPGTGHMWPDEDAAGFTATVLDFLKSLHDYTAR